MSPEQFVYWLQGFAEMSPQAELSKVQWQIVKDHLAKVFDKRTPNRSPHFAPAVPPAPVLPSDQDGIKFPPMPAPILPVPATPMTPSMPWYEPPRIIC